MSEKPWNVLACESLGKRAAALRKLTAGRRSADAEYIHDVRVASRRLKEALGVFGASVEHGRAGEWKKTIRTMLAVLGESRDKEVQLETLQDFSDRHKALRKDAGLARLAADLTKSHRKLDRKARKAIKVFEKAGVLREIGGSIEKACPDEGGAGGPQDSQIYTQIAQIVARRMEGVKKYGRFAGRPDRVAELHQLRLSLKKLRYTLELFAPVCDGALDESIATVAKLQQALGDMHDSAVWLDNLAAGISEKTATEGVLSFQRVQKDAYRRHYKSFLKIWTKAGTRKTWTRMQQAIKTKHINAVKRQERQLLWQVKGQLSAVRAGRSRRSSI
jgi:CHAD domain-containing protein